MNVLAHHQPNVMTERAQPDGSSADRVETDPTQQKNERMSPQRYTWLIDTKVPPEILRRLLTAYRPFRVDVNFTNGFSTREFQDVSAYTTAEPLAKLHYFGEEIDPDGKRIADIGCHLGYYGHYLLGKGARHFIGIESNQRLHDGAHLLAALAECDRSRLRFEFLNFASESSSSRLAGLGQFDIVLSLASINNMMSLTLALDNLASMIVPGGVLVLEYLALERSEAVCEFRKHGIGPDSSLYWVPTEAFMDDYLGSRGLRREKSLLRWQNPQILAPNHLKLMATYRRLGS